MIGQRVSTYIRSLFLKIQPFSIDQFLYFVFQCLAVFCIMANSSRMIITLSIWVISFWIWGFYGLHWVWDHNGVLDKMGKQFEIGHRDWIKMHRFSFDSAYNPFLTCPCILIPWLGRLWWCKRRSLRWEWRWSRIWCHWWIR